VPHAHTVPQHFLPVVHQQDAEGVVVDQAAHGFGDLAEQLVELQN
jgi:hypothetical protein